MKSYVVNMTVKIVYDDGHVEFSQIEAKANGESGLIAADKCFKKNKRAYDNVSRVTEVTMFEYEANEITHNPTPSEDESEPNERKTIGFWGNFVLKAIATVEAWVWIDALLVSAIYLLWYALHAVKGDTLSSAVDTRVITVVISSILIAVAFSVSTRTILSLLRVRGLYKRTGRLLSGISSVAAISFATAINFLVCYILLGFIN